jgi:hypothetical protein
MKAESIPAFYSALDSKMKEQRDRKGKQEDHAGATLEGFRVRGLTSSRLWSAGRRVGKSGGKMSKRYDVWR